MFGVIIGIDIKDFTKITRTNEMLVQREQLVQIINTGTAQIEAYKKRKILDTGDGCYILIDSLDYENILLGLKKIQSVANEKGALKFRGIVHVGRFEKTTKMLDANIADESYVGEGINDASRYLNAQCLRDMLKMNTHNFVYGISNEFYMQIFYQQYHVDSEYTRYIFKAEEYSNQIFLNNVNIDYLPNTGDNIKDSNNKKEDLARLWY